MKIVKPYMTESDKDSLLEDIGIALMEYEKNKYKQNMSYELIAPKEFVKTVKAAIRIYHSATE